MRSFQEPLLVESLKETKERHSTLNSCQVPSPSSKAKRKYKDIETCGNPRLDSSTWRETRNGVEAAKQEAQHSGSLSPSPTTHILSNLFQEIEDLVPQPVLPFDHHPSRKHNDLLRQVAAMLAL